MAQLPANTRFFDLESRIALLQARDGPSKAPPGRLDLEEDMLASS